MKATKIIMALVAIASTMFITGCDDLPTPEKMKNISTVIGKTAGYACELAKTKEEVKNGILTVLDVASTVVPAEGHTFTEEWTPVIDEELKKLVEKGKIAEGEVVIAKLALSAATEGIDYVFVKYPKARDVKELVSASTEGFVNGFKSVVALARDAKLDIDEEAYKYIKARMSSSK